jgi:CheY-like chemotaxis protein
MLSTDGFWTAISSTLFWIVVALVIYWFKEEIKNLISNRNLHLKIGDKEVTISEATKSLGNYVTDIQERLAALELFIEVSRGSVTQDASREDVFYLKGDNRNNILWVDDFPSNNAFIIERLEKSGFKIDISLSTHDALKKFTALDHGIIISDLGRIENGKDNQLAGIDLVNSIRRINKSVPILIFAGQRGIALRDRLLKAGASQVTASGVEVMKFIEEQMGK